MKIMPVVRSAVVFLREDGTIEKPAFQVFRHAGGACIRIGRNAFFFDADGHLTGTECKAGSDVDPDAAREAYMSTPDNNTRPREPYFLEGSKGWADETRGWPVDPRETRR